MSELEVEYVIQSVALAHTDRSATRSSKWSLACKKEMIIAVRSKRSALLLLSQRLCKQAKRRALLSGKVNWHLVDFRWKRAST